MRYFAEARSSYRVDDSTQYKGKETSMLKAPVMSARHVARLA